MCRDEIEMDELICRSHGTMACAFVLVSVSPISLCVRMGTNIFAFNRDGRCQFASEWNDDAQSTINHCIHTAHKQIGSMAL